MGKQCIEKQLSIKQDNSKYRYYTKGKTNAYAVAQNRKSGKVTKIKGSNFKREKKKLYFVKDNAVRSVDRANA